MLLGRSVDGGSQYLNYGEVSLHRVQSGKTHESRAMNARPRLASAAASRFFGSVARIPDHSPQFACFRRRLGQHGRHGRRDTLRIAGGGRSACIIELRRSKGGSMWSVRVLEDEGQPAVAKNRIGTSYRACPL